MTEGIRQGLADLAAGSTRPAREVFAELRDDFTIEEVRALVQEGIDSSPARPVDFEAIKKEGRTKAGDIV